MPDTSPHILRLPVPPGTFPELPNLPAVNPPPGTAGEPLLDYDAFTAALDDLADRIARERRHFHDDAQWQTETLQRIADIHATIRAGIVLPADRVGAARMLFAAVVHGETIGADYTAPSSALSRPDRFDRWKADRPGTFLAQYTIGAVAELDRVRGLPVSDRGLNVIDATFADAPGLQPLDIHRHGNDPFPEAISREEARRAVIDLVRKAQADVPVLDAGERSNAARQLLMKLGESTHLYDVRRGWREWSADDLARARRLCASLAAGEDATLRLDGNDVWKAFIDDIAFEGWLDARNEPILTEWAGAALHGTSIVPAEVLSARWSDPVADAAAVIRKAEYAADRVSLRDESDGVGFATTGIVLYAPLPELTEYPTHPIRSRSAFIHQLALIDRDQFNEEGDKQRTITNVLHAVREGRFLATRDQAGRAEQLLHAASLGTPLVVPPPLGSAIGDPQTYHGWAISYLSALNERQMEMETAAIDSQPLRELTRRTEKDQRSAPEANPLWKGAYREATSEIEHPHEQQLAMAFADAENMPDPDVMYGPVTALVAELIGDPCEEQVQQAIQAAEDIGQDGIKRLVMELAEAAAGQGRDNARTRSESSGLAAAVTGAAPTLGRGTIGSVATADHTIAANEVGHEVLADGPR